MDRHPVEHYRESDGALDCRGHGLRPGRQPGPGRASATFAVDNTPPQVGGGEALYVAQQDGPVMVYGDLSNTSVHHTVGPANRQDMFGLAVDSSGNVYEGYLNAVTKYNSAGVPVSGFGTGGTTSTSGEPFAMALNPAGTTLVVPFHTQGTFGAFDTTTGSAAAGFTAISDTGYPDVAAYNTSGTYLYTGDEYGHIYRCSTSGGATTALTVSGSFPGEMWGLLFQDDTHFLLVSHASGTVTRYTLSGTSATLDTTFGTSGSVSVAGAFSWPRTQTGTSTFPAIKGATLPNSHPAALF